MQNGSNHLRAILDQIHDGIYFVDPDRRITYWNKSAERITGYSADQVIGQYCFNNILSHVDERGSPLCHHGCPLKSTIDTGSPTTAEIYLHHKDGHRVPICARCAPMLDENNNIIGGIETFSEATTHVHDKNRIEKLERAALLDPLTQLPNRRYIESFIESKFEEQKRHQWPFAIIMFDIDRFKNINDSFGHNFGDQIIKLVSKTLHHATRQYDLIGRWGGEEFISVISHAKPDKLYNTADRMRIMIEQSSIKHQDRPFSTTVSVGATLAKPDDTLPSIINRADTLLYQSKHAGRNRTTTDLHDEPASLSLSVLEKTSAS
ncbi:diguanylate cyclase [Poriferisphaera sp. WC338]|uniref:sensor domain-containing diguanylate cyclase n=1 Tax=Poriferisphaera sp. WC338 TaxID=3425129 RepID=UPI003D81A018